MAKRDNPYELSDVVLEGLSKPALKEGDKLQITNNALYSDGLAFANGKDKPRMSPVQMKEFLRIMEKYGPWPFGVGPASIEFKDKYQPTATAWVPRMEE